MIHLFCQKHKYVYSNNIQNKVGKETLVKTSFCRYKEQS